MFNICLHSIARLGAISAGFKGPCQGTQAPRRYVYPRRCNTEPSYFLRHAVLAPSNTQPWYRLSYIINSCRSPSLPGPPPVTPHLTFKVNVSRNRLYVKESRLNAAVRSEQVCLWNIAKVHCYVTTVCLYPVVLVTEWRDVDVKRTGSV